MQTRCADDVGAGGFVGHLGGGWLTKGGEGLVEARARAPRLPGRPRSVTAKMRRTRVDARWVDARWVYARCIDLQTFVCAL